MARPADPNARSAVVAAARAAFFEHGIRGARIEDITAACGLSKGAFYLHFPSKEALFAELVGGFLEKMERFTATRTARLVAFERDHGRLTGRDYARRSRRYEALIALEAELDLVPLELMWEHRDLLIVLMRGSEGTEFQGVMWDVLKGQADRVAAEFRGAQQTGACRADVPPELFGSLVVGAYFVTAQQMAAAAQKPDLPAIARSLQRLIREGAAPWNAREQDEVSAPARRAVRGQSAATKTRRPGARRGNRG